MRILNNRILLKAVEPEKSDIIKPYEVKHYEVAGVGPKVEEVKVGDKVLYQQGAKVNILGEEYVLIEPDDLICVLE